MKRSRIQLSRRKGARMPPGAVNCARPGRYGNPFRVVRGAKISFGHPWHYWQVWEGKSLLFGKFADKDSARRYAVFQFQKKIAAMTPTARRAFLVPLRSARFLACWCPPSAACHCDVLLDALNALDREEKP